MITGLAIFFLCITVAISDWKATCRYQVSAQPPALAVARIYMQHRVEGGIFYCADACFKHPFCHSAGYYPDFNGITGFCLLSYHPAKSCENPSTFVPFPVEFQTHWATWIFCINVSECFNEKLKAENFLSNSTEILSPGVDRTPGEEKNARKFNESDSEKDSEFKNEFKNETETESNFETDTWALLNFLAKKGIPAKKGATRNETEIEEDGSDIGEENDEIGAKESTADASAVAVATNELP